MNRKPESLYQGCHIGQKVTAQQMLDTIEVLANWPVHSPLPGRRRHVLLARCIDIRLDETRQFVRWVKVSLPKLFFGCNGSVIQNEGQLTAALTKLVEELRAVADVPPETEWQLSRIDLAWNFDLPAPALILGHACLRVPGVGNGADLWRGGHGVSWRGRRSQFIVQLYDKCREMRVHGSVLRAEIRLKGRQLARHLRGQSWCDFSAMYHVFRAVLATIPSIQKPTKAASWQDAVGMEDEAVRNRIMARLHRPGRTFRRWRQRAQAAAARLQETFSWANLLPTDGPPAAVNVMPRPRRGRSRQAGPKINEPNPKPTNENQEYKNQGKEAEWTAIDPPTS